jgi:hypothetical protein
MCDEHVSQTTSAGCACITYGLTPKYDMYMCDLHSALIRCECLSSDWLYSSDWCVRLYWLFNAYAVVVPQNRPRPSSSPSFRIPTLPSISFDFVEWLALLLNIQDVPYLILGLKTIT